MQAMESILWTLVITFSSHKGFFLKFKGIPQVKNRVHDMKRSKEKWKAIFRNEALEGEETVASICAWIGNDEKGARE
jgi:hypothetical protein